MNVPTTTVPRLDTLLWIGAATIWLGLMLVPLANAWAFAPDLRHGWSAPILIGYLWWERLRDRPRTVAIGPRFHRSHLAAILPILALIIPLRLTLIPFPLWPAALWLYTGSLIFLGLYVVWIKAGWSTARDIGSPLLILFGVIPWPGVIERELILPLREGITALIAESSNLLGAPALAIGTSVQLAGGWVAIDEACGGIRSLHACVTAALFLGVWWQLGWRRKIGLIGIAFGSAIIGNVARVGFLTWCAAKADGSIERWHDVAGWAALALSLILTSGAGWRWLRATGNRIPIANVSPRARDNTGWEPTATVVAATLALTLVVIEAGARWHFRDSTILTNGASAWTAAFPVDNPTYRTEPLSDAAFEMLKPDHFVSGHWRGPDRTLYTANYIEWQRGQVARSAPFAHNPTICLPFTGFALAEELGIIEIPWGETSIPFHRYVFKRMNDELVVAFTVWDPSRQAPLLAREVDRGWLAWMRNQWREVSEGRKDQPAQLLALGILGQENAHRLPGALAKLITTAPSDIASP